MQKNMNATITCPECGYKQNIDVPKDKCLPFYQCDGCRKLIKAKKGSCCVICDYSDKKCPVSTRK